MSFPAQTSHANGQASPVNAAPQDPPGFERVDVGDGFSSTLGPLYYRKSGPEGELAFFADQHVTNIQGMVHRGALATFADLLPIVAQLDGRLDDVHCPTISLNIDYVAPAAAGSWITGTIDVVRKTGRMVFTQGIIRVAQEPVARCNMIYHLPRRR